jgi:hypothetical protein
MLAVSIGLFITGFFAFLGVLHTRKYSEESVIQRWSAMLPGLASEGSEFLDRVYEELKTKKISNSTSQKRIRSNLTSIFQDEFLSCRMNADYCCYVSYNITGDDLYVHWLVQDNSFRWVHKLPFIGPLMRISTFAMTNRVISFTTGVHSAVLDVTDQIIDEHNIDSSKVNRKSSGKLGPI